MKAWTVWLTGLPGSGKSTITEILLTKLKERKIFAQVLSSDMLRKIITPKPSYSEQERQYVYATCVLIAKFLNQNKINVIIDATANRRQYRETGRKELKNLILVYTKCPLEICMQRETKRKTSYGAPKEIYKKGINGRSSTVPGLNVIYDEPLDADIVLETDKMSPDKCAEKIVKIIITREKRD